MWDVDDVLNHLMYDWFEQKWQQENPECLFDYNDLIANPPHDILGISKSEYLQSLDEFRIKKMMDLHPNQEVLRWFKEYGHKYRHLVITATPMHTAELSAQWVIHHFGQWIRCFNFVPSERKGQNCIMYDSSKQDLMQWLGNVDIMIDDSPVNVKEAQAIGIKSYLVSRPWNCGGLVLTDVLEALKDDRS